ncbi:hypothetical protein HPB52_004380 [Rhipicephalus sanguineus]|uniref:Uncharacterized protein n=1 Tax=Rhipicephalus sanguineus TaxID=34632 RepID=A0A9D4QB00_RHISA|nr:hypothetical protein HPB52_004380 [Rhipicephalus sanguineus]
MRLTYLEIVTLITSVYKELMRESVQQLTIAASQLLTSASGVTVIVRMPEQGTNVSEKVARNRAEQGGAGGSGTPRKQSRVQMLESAITAGEARNDVVLKFLDALMSANIPLEKKRPELTGVPQLADESLALAAEWQVYLKTVEEIKTSDKDLATFLSKQETPGAGFDVLTLWAGMEQPTPTLS